MKLTYRIRRHERGLRFRHGELVAVLQPGTYRLWSRLVGRKRDTVEVVSTLEPLVTHPQVAEFLATQAFRDAVTVIDLAESQRAIVWKDGRLAAILGPGQYALWNPQRNEPVRVRVETYDATEFRFRHERADAVAANPAASRWLESIVVEPWEEALLFRNGALVERLGPGKHLVWKSGAKVTWTSVDLRQQVLEAAGQELLTADKVSIRATLVVNWMVEDPIAAVTKVPSTEHALYRDAQLAMRTVIGARTLDSLLADKNEPSGEIFAALAPTARSYGVTVRGAGLRDLILPGEMREILTKVLVAEKESQANLIRRREETAAARSQANTAKLLADNPGLIRLRELETLETVLKGAKLTLVAGRGDLATQLKALVGAADETPNSSPHT